MKTFNKGEIPMIRKAKFKDISYNSVELNDFIAYLESTKIKPTNEVYYDYILKYSKTHTIRFLCTLFGVGRSSFYDWLKKKDLPDPDESIRDLIFEIRAETYNETMGYRLVTEYLNREKQIRINHKKVYRIMKKYGLLSASIHSKKQSVLYKGIRPFSNLVNRNFNVEGKNSFWCIDITKIDSKEGRQYLCAIIDLYDRSIVGFKIFLNQTVGLVKSTIENALKKQDLIYSPQLVLHSDQGRVFKSGIIGKLIKELPIVQSMGEKASPCENSVIESFFASLKKEMLYINDFETNNETALSVITYIYFYNNLRKHSYNNCTPSEKRLLSC